MISWTTMNDHTKTTSQQESRQNGHKLIISQKENKSLMDLLKIKKIQI